MLDRVARTTNNSKRIYGRPFQKGVSGNPAGRPVINKFLKELAQNFAIEKIHHIANLIGNKRVKHSDQIAAWIALHDRGFGKPVQATEITVHKPQPLQILSVDNLLLDKPTIELEHQE